MKGDSHPIAKYLGEKLGYYPSDPELRKDIDQLCSDVNDIFDGVIAPCGFDGPEDEKLEM